MNFKRNLIDLIKEAHLFQYANISDTPEEIKRKKPLFFFVNYQWILILFSIFVSLTLDEGFTKEFAGYIISGMSLFIGLFFTFLITLYNKFSSIDFSQYHLSVSEEKHTIGVRLKNFFKKITILSLYSVVLSIVCIILLAITLLCPLVSSTIDLCYVYFNISNYTFGCLIEIFLILTYRIVVLYFLSNFILMTLFLISAFYDFIISEYNKVKLS